jgi:hypothetical protein
VIPDTITTHEEPLARVLRIRERSEGRVIGETEELMEEGNIVLLRDDLRGARRVAADKERPLVDQERPIWPHTEEAEKKEMRVVLPPSSSFRCGILPRRAKCSSSSGTDLGAMLLFITSVPNTKLCAWGEEDRGGHVL